MIYLKQSTASQSVLIGPFVDDTDGVTAETGLTISNTDIRLSKNGANIVAKNSGGGTHDENGWYTITLDATDTNTVGRLQIHVAESGALPVWLECQVLEEDIYDALFGASADAFDSNARIKGIAGTKNDLDDLNDIAATAIVSSGAITTSGGAVSTVTSVSNQVTADVTAISGDSTAANNLEADYDGTGYNKSASTIGTCTANTDMRGTDSAYTGTPPTSAAIADAVWDEATSGHTTAGTYGKAVGDGVTDWVTATGFSTHSAADVWTNGTRTLTSLGFTFAAGDFGASSLDGKGDWNTTTPPTVGAIADQVWTEAIADHSGTSGSTAEALSNASSAGDPWSTAIPGAYGAGTAGNVLGNLNDLSAADVNAEVDTALADYDAPTKTEMDTAFTEIKGATWSSSTDTLEEIRDNLGGGGGDATAANQSTIITHLTDIKGATWATTDSLESIRDRGDAAWVTGNTTTPPTAAAIRAEIDSNSTQLAAIVADTNELQGDWANGGRLDLILDATATQTSVDAIDSNVDAILVDTGTTIPAQITALNDISVSDVLTTAMTESYGTDGSAVTLAQACYIIMQGVGEFAISGTTKTVKQLDGSTTAATYTLDDADNPTSITRAT